jgi:hypothetical protein
MWSYYGSKTNMVKHYPKPTTGKIIEPFAGAAKYSLFHFENDVELWDKYSDLITVWKYLQQASEKDVMNLPRVERGKTLNDYDLSEGEKLFMGFVIAKGGQSPRLTPSPNATINRPNTINYTLKRVSKNLFKIKHWKINLGSYEQIENQHATYFIDPPYQFGGHVYVESNKNIDFNQLAEWCRTRNGQVIVCENMKADWLEFKPLGTQRTSTGWQQEAIWTNYKTIYDNVQLKLIA